MYRMTVSYVLRYLPQIIFVGFGKITYICELCSGICKDAGYSSVAGQIEIFGKLSVLAAGMPILLAILESIQEIAG